MVKNKNEKRVQFRQAERYVFSFADSFQIALLLLFRRLKQNKSIIFSIRFHAIRQQFSIHSTTQPRVFNTHTQTCSIRYTTHS